MDKEQKITEQEMKEEYVSICGGEETGILPPIDKNGRPILDEE